MKECDNCAYGGWLNGKDAIAEICTKCRYICGEPTKWKAMPMTNADRIRDMSDEELAKFLADEIPHGDCCGCELECATFEGDKFENSCNNAFYRWLKQPYEEE